VLEGADLVRRRRQGREHVLTLNPEPLSAASAWIEELRALWAWRLAKLNRILQETTL
jgi:hypothetical protein